MVHIYEPTSWAAQQLLKADGVRHARATAEPAGARTPQLNHALARQGNVNAQAGMVQEVDVV